MPRRLKKPPYPTPELPPHWHAGECSCEPGVAYIRVSMVGKREQILSPELQLDSIVAYAKANNIRLVKVVSDIDRTGRTFRKRSVDKIIAEIKKGAYARVVLWKWSRWSRNEFESTKYLTFVREAGGRVDSATEDIDQTTAMGRFQKGVLGLVDQLVSEQLSEGWESAHNKRREAGLPHAGGPRFGYDYVRQEREVDGRTQIVKAYVPNEVQAAALAAAYAKINEGASFGKTANWLNDQGLRTTGGELWAASSLTRMMDTGFAAGLIRERSEPTERPAVKITDYDIWRTGSHSPIIDIATWTQYRDGRVARSRFAPRSANAAHELSGLINCVECLRRHGLRITLQVKYTGRAKSLFWSCPRRVTHHPDVSVGVSNRLLIEYVRERVREVAGIGESVDPQARIVFEHRMAESPDLPDPDKVNAEIRRWKLKLKNLRDLYNDEDISREEFRESRDEYEAEVRKREAILEELKRSASNRPDYSAFRALDELWLDLEPGRVRNLLAELVEVILVSPRTDSSSTNSSAAERVELVGRWDSERILSINTST